MSFQAAQPALPMTAERVLEKKGHKVLSVREGVTLQTVIAELARHRVGARHHEPADGEAAGTDAGHHDRSGQKNPLGAKVVSSVMMSCTGR